MDGFQFHIINKDKVTNVSMFDEANQFCKNFFNGGNLVSVDSKAKEHVIASLITKHAKESNIKDAGYLIGKI